MYMYIYMYIHVCGSVGSSPSECQIFHLFHCVLSSMLPLRSVGRFTFDKGLHSLSTLIKKRHILMRTAVLYVYIHMYVHIYIYMCVCVYIYIVKKVRNLSPNKNVFNFYS